jgi:very-short-patch-repair endonuclease
LSTAIHRARELRNNLTDAERTLWRHLRLRQINGHKFRRQRPIGPYIVDFVCLEKRVVVEVDGGQHSEQIPYDEKRDAWLRAEGFAVLRFWDHEVLTQLDSVKQSIWRALRNPLFDSPP